MNSGHVLLVDDDNRIRELLTRYLASQGYSVTEAPEAASARKLLDMFVFDVAILDVMMPGEDGFSLLTFIRTTSQLPVLLLTAKGLVEDRVEGLKIGADDYLSKPFEPEELALRLKAILRRTIKVEPMQEISLSGLMFDYDRSLLSDDTRTVRLTESETQLLMILASKVGEAVSREDLAPNPEAAMDRSIDVQVTRLRKKIEPDPARPVHILTVRGVGYRLMPD